MTSVSHSKQSPNLFSLPLKRDELACNFSLSVVPHLLQTAVLMAGELTMNGFACPLIVWIGYLIYSYSNTCTSVSIVVWCMIVTILIFLLPGRMEIDYESFSDEELELELFTPPPAV